MKRLCNLRAGLILCAVTTGVMGASQLVAQNQPATQNPSDSSARGEQKSETAEQPSQQNGLRAQVGHQADAPQQVGLGIQFETQANSGHGLEIGSVDPNSPAAQAGLQAHDRVISIDGRPFAHRRHAKAYLTAQTGRPVPLMIERNGRQLLLHFVPGNPEGDSGWLGILLYGENEMAPNAQNTPAAQSNTPAIRTRQAHRVAVPARWAAVPSPRVAARIHPMPGRMHAAKEGRVSPRSIREVLRPALACSPETW